MTEETTNIIPLDGCFEQFRDLLTKDVDIPYGRFNYPCRLKLNPLADYLSVQLHGSLPRGAESPLPVFARWNWGKVLGAHVLSICDPTLYLDDTLTIGWYLGNKEESAIPGVVAIAERCADAIGIAKGQIIYSGGSGGGFAALQAAALAKEGKALAINPQTDLLKYVQQHLRNYATKASGCASLEEARSVFGDRWNAIHSLQKSCARGNRPKIVIVQNRNEWHHEKHFTPFTEAFGLNRQDAKSINGNFMSLLYDGPHEHGPEPSEVVKRINNEGVPFLLNKTIDTGIPDISTHIALASGKILAVVQTSGDDYQFACYLCKNGVTVEKQFYSSNNKFTFNPSGPGEYLCRGFVRNKSNEIFSSSSDIINFSP